MPPNQLCEGCSGLQDNLFKKKFESLKILDMTAAHFSSQNSLTLPSNTGITSPQDNEFLLTLFSENKSPLPDSRRGSLVLEGVFTEAVKFLSVSEAEIAQHVCEAESCTNLDPRYDK
jgi:hypothetical protein